MKKVSLAIFANFFINNEERLQRMKDSFYSFKDINSNEWIINIRGKFKHHAGEFLKNELGMVLKKGKEKFIIDLGSYEHFYEDNFLDNKKFSTHYVVLAYLLRYDHLTPIKGCEIKEQHSEYLWIDIDEVNIGKYNIHENTLEYFKNPLFKKL